MTFMCHLFLTLCLSLGFTFGQAEFVSDPWPKCSLLSSVESKCTASVSFSNERTTITDVCREFGRWTMIRHQIPVKKTDGSDCLLFIWSYHVYTIGVYCPGDSSPVLLDSYNSLVDFHVTPVGPLLLYYKGSLLEPGIRPNETEDRIALRLSLLVHSTTGGWQLRSLHEAIPWPRELLDFNGFLYDDFSFTYLGRLGRGDGRLVFFINGNWHCPVFLVDPVTMDVELSPALPNQRVPFDLLNYDRHSHAALASDHGLVVVVARVANSLLRNAQGRPTYICRLTGVRLPTAGKSDSAWAVREIVGPEQIPILGVVGEDGIVVSEIPSSLPPLTALGPAALPGPSSVRFLVAANDGAPLGSNDIDDAMFALQFNPKTGQWHSILLCGGTYGSSLPCASLSVTDDTPRVFSMGQSMLVLSGSNVVTVFRQNQLCTVQLPDVTANWRALLAPDNKNLLIIGDGAGGQNTILSDGNHFLTLGLLPDCSALCLGPAMHFIGNSAIIMATKDEVSVVVSLAEWIENLASTPSASSIGCAVSPSASLYLTVAVKGSRLSNGDFLMMVDRDGDGEPTNDYCDLQRIAASSNPNWMRDLPLLSEHTAAVSPTNCIIGGSHASAELVGVWDLMDWEKQLGDKGISSTTVALNNQTMTVDPNHQSTGLATVLVAVGVAFCALVLIAAVLAYCIVGRRRRQVHDNARVGTVRSAFGTNQGRRSAHSRSRSGTDTSATRPRPLSSSLNRRSHSRLNPVAHSQFARPNPVVAAPVDSEFVCPQCNKQYPSEADLAVHVSKRHHEYALASYTTTNSIEYTRPDPPKNVYNSKGLRQPDEQVQYALDGLESPPASYDVVESEVEPSHSNIPIPYNSPLRVNEFEKFQQ